MRVFFRLIVTGLLTGATLSVSSANAQEGPSLESARALYDAGRLDEARGELETLVSAGTRDPGVYLLLGVVERTRGRYGSAINSLEVARQIDPGGGAIAIELATTLAWNDDLVRAADLYREVLEREPENSGARAGLGFALAWQGRLQEASEIFETLMAQDSADVSGWAGTGYIARARHDRRAAVSAYSRVLELDPGNAEALAALEGLRWDRRTELRGVSGVTRISDVGNGTEARLSAVFAASPKVTLIGGVQRYAFGVADPIVRGGASGREEWSVEAGTVFRPTMRTVMAATLNTFFSGEERRGILWLEGATTVSRRLSLLVNLRPAFSTEDPEASFGGAFGGTVSLPSDHQLTGRVLVAGNTTYEPRFTGLLNYGASPSQRLRVQGSLAHAEDDRFGFTSFSAGFTFLPTPTFGLSVDGNHRRGAAARSTLLAGLIVRL